VASSPWILWQVWKFVEPGLYEHERRFARLLVPGSIVLTICGILTLYYIMLPFSLEVLVNYGINERGTTAPALAPLPPDPQSFTPLLPMLDGAPAEVVPGQAWIDVPRRLFCVPILAPDGTVSVLTMPLTKDSAYLQVYRMSEYLDFVLLLMLGVAIAFQMPLAILLLGWVGIIRIETLRGKRKHAFFVLTIISAVITPTTDLTSMLLMLVPLYLLYELGILLLAVVPPGAVSEGTVMRGFFRRLRESRPSGKGRARPAQTEPPTRPNPTPALTDQTAPTGRREPDGDADEHGAGSDPS
jgi:Sec-independent protein secretion pathway component TatC